MLENGAFDLPLAPDRPILIQTLTEGSKLWANAELVYLGARDGGGRRSCLWRVASLEVKRDGGDGGAITGIPSLERSSPKVSQLNVVSLLLVAAVHLADSIRSPHPLTGHQGS
jgi:hypothetical protein